MVTPDDGEDFNDVALTLARVPGESGATSAPESDPVIAFRTRRFLSPGVRIRRPCQKRAARRRPPPSRRSSPGRDAAGGGQIGAYQSSFVAPGRVSLAADGSSPRGRSRCRRKARRPNCPGALTRHRSRPARFSLRSITSTARKRHLLPVLRDAFATARLSGRSGCRWSRAHEAGDLGFGADERVR